MIGSHLECGTWEFDEDELEWGDRLKANWDTSHVEGLKDLMVVFSPGEAVGMEEVAEMDAGNVALVEAALMMSMDVVLVSPWNPSSPPPSTTRPT
jgi:hypothetical protein